MQPLTYEEMLILTEKLADIHAGLYDYSQIVTQQDMVDFIEIEFGRIGADTHITPREVIRDFIEVLDIVYQNPGISVRGASGFRPVPLRPERGERGTDRRFPCGI